MNKRYLNYGRILFGLLGLSAIVTEIIVLRIEGVFHPANFFSFFTILSNIAAALFLLYYGFSTADSKKLQIIRGAITLYMLMTGIIFAILLSGLEGVRLTATPWDNIVLHYIMPLVVVLDWFSNPPRKEIPSKVVGSWVLFPIVYVIYTLIRGSVVGWYPYPFLNPSHSSYAQVATTTLIIALFVVAAAFLLQHYSVIHAKQSVK